MTAERNVRHVYRDPVDVIWTEAARRLGMHVERTADAYASWDGEATLRLAQGSHLDADDSLAQLIFHEICHALVAGPAGRARADWGLDNTSNRDLVYEHACHRVQAALSDAHGLRGFFAVTTEWRPYWDALPSDPLGHSADPALPLARRGIAEAERSPYREVLAEALAATATIASAVRPFAPVDSLWVVTRPPHASGFASHEDSALRCGGCAWFRRTSRGFGCRQAERVHRTATRIESDMRACRLWEPKLGEESCGPCGACCREGFDRVELRPRDTLLRRHPELVSSDRFGTFVPRPDGRCLALDGDGAEQAYRCRVYSDRPRACAEFEIAGSACLVARRRAGLSG